MKRVAFFVFAGILGAQEITAQPSNNGGGLIITRMSSAVITSGTTVISGGIDQSICFTDVTVVNCADAGIKFAKSTGTLTVTTIASGFNLGNADTTITRSAAGKVAVEGVDLVDVSSAQTLSTKTIASGVYSGAQTLAAGAYILAPVNSGFLFIDTAESRLQYRNEPTPDGMIISLGPVSNSVRIAEVADGAFDPNNGHCGTSTCTDPTLIIFSHNQNVSQYIDFRHDGTNAQIVAGTGGIVFTTSSAARFAIDGAGHLLTAGTAPAVSACGASPTVVTGNDISGNLTTGSGGTVQSCTLTFATAYSAAPACDCQDTSSILAVRATTTTTTLVCDSAVAGSLASQLIRYKCIQ